VYKGEGGYSQADENDAIKTGRMDITANEGFYISNPDLPNASVYVLPRTSIIGTLFIATTPWLSTPIIRFTKEKKTM
jgi:hypothetical protein